MFATSLRTVVAPATNKQQRMVVCSAKPAAKPAPVVAEPQKLCNVHTMAAKCWCGKSKKVCSTLLHAPYQLAQLKPHK